jgi:6-phosphogluconate dehydrogenase
MGQIPRTSGGQPRRTAEQGYLHCGPSGAGHFVKMVHNGIEYGLMQAYAEGFDILRNAGSADLDAGPRYDLDCRDIAEVWRRGSVVSSWLLDLTAQALAESPALSNYTGIVQDSGEGRWTVIAAIEAGVPVDVLSVSLFTRFRSRQEHTSGRRCCPPCARSSAGTSSPPPGSEQLFRRRRDPRTPRRDAWRGGRRRRGAARRRMTGCARPAPS